MKQSNNNKKSRDVTAFLYERLSRDDNMDGESYSIGNQKKLLTKVAKEKGYTNLVHFFDDGISGVTMDRPGFADMIQQLEQGKAAAVFVKDLSRLGRNYIEVGRLTEEFFPNHDIRLVAVSDNIDTDEGENELAPEIEKQSSRAASTDMFVSIVRKYTRARKLTPRMLNELVEKIEVYNAEKIDGEWVQRLRIHYNCVGEMNIPNEPALSIPAVTVNTRKGVFVSYTTDDRPAV